MKTAVVVALGGAALLLSGCAGDSQAQVGGSASPRPDTLVLRTKTTGGIAGLGGPGTLPDFSLYGDGRAITGGAHPMEYHLTQRALRRLVAEARKAGLATPRTVDDRNIADAMYKSITFVTGGRPRVTKIIEGGHADDPAARFLPRLVPSSWPRGDQASAPRPYEPRHVAVLSVAVPANDAAAPAWPLEPLGTGSPVGGRTCTVLNGDDAARAQHLGMRPAWRDGGRTFRVTVRPLLPDESGCAALTR